jgi:hypothetical protein
MVSKSLKRLSLSNFSYWYSFIQENTNRVKKFGELAYVVDPAAVNHLKRNKSYF